MDSRHLLRIRKLLTIVDFALKSSKMCSPALDQVDFIDAETGWRNLVDDAVEVMWVVIIVRLCVTYNKHTS